MKRILQFIVIIILLGVVPVGAGKPAAWVRILSTTDQNVPVSMQTQDYTPQRGWAYRNYKFEQDAYELTKQMQRAGIQTILHDQTSFHNGYLDTYLADRDGARDTVMHGNLLAGRKMQAAAHRLGMTSIAIISYRDGGESCPSGFDDAGWAYTDSIASVIWDEYISKPGYEYHANGKPVLILFMPPDMAAGWEADYDLRDPALRTHLDRFKIEIAPHRFQHDFPNWGWRPLRSDISDPDSILYGGDERVRACTSIYDYDGSACTAEQWSERVAHVLDAAEYSVFCSYSDAESGDWGIMRHIAGHNFSGNSLFLPPSDDPLFYYETLSKMAGGTASTFNEAVYDYGTNGIFDVRTEVGSATVSGNSMHDNCVYSLSGAGTGIGSTADQFHYLSKSWSDNGTLTARIDEMSVANVQSAAGIMVRASLGTDAPFSFLGLRGDNSLACTYRDTVGAASTELVVPNIGTPTWVRMNRANSRCTAEYSTNGFDWVELGTSAVAENPLVGLAVSSHDAGRLSSAKISNVSISSPAGDGAVLMSTRFDGAAVGLTNGQVYTDSALDTDTTFDSGRLSSLSQTLLNGDSPATSKAVVAPGNKGLAAAAPNHFENGMSYGARVRVDYSLGNASSGERIEMDTAELVVSGVTNRGFRAQVAWRLPDLTVVSVPFNEGADLTNGVYVISLSSHGLEWSDAASPLQAGGNFRLILADAGTGGADGIIESFTVRAKNLFNSDNYDLLFSQYFDGIESGLVAGDDYTEDAFDQDRSFDSALLASLGGTFVSTDSAATSKAVVAPDNLGISPGPTNYFENALSFAPRVGPRYNLGNAAPGQSVRMNYATVSVSGVASNGFQASVAWKQPDGTEVFRHFNDGAPVKNGTYVVDLRPDNLVFTDSSSPFQNGDSFRLVLFDSGEGADGTDGILEAFNVYAETGSFLSAPSGLRAVPGSGFVSLDWADHDSASGYAVYRQFVGWNSILLKVGETTQSDFVDDTVVDEFEYEYVVRALDSNGVESAGGSTVLALPSDDVPPSAPALLVGAAGSGWVALDWADNADSDLGGYHVYRRLLGEGFSRIASNVTSSSYLDWSVASETSYVYAVSAVDISDNESGLSEETLVHPSQRTIFAQAFGGLSSGVTNGQVYTDSMLDADRTVNAELVQSVGGTMVNSASPATSPMTVAEGNAGIEAAAPNYLENSMVFGSRTRVDWTIGNAVATSFAPGVAELEISGMSGNGLKASIAWRPSVGSDVIVPFNDGLAITANGMYSLDLSASNLLWTATNTPVSSFRLLFSDAVGGQPSGGVIESFVLYKAVPGTDPYLVWADGHGLSGDEAKRTADGDIDGLLNLFEYAFGGNPTVDDAAAVSPKAGMVQLGGSNAIEYVFNRRTDDPSLQYNLYVNTNLVDGAWVDVDDTYVSGVGDSGMPDVSTVTNLIPMVEQQKFITLEVKD